MPEVRIFPGSPSAHLKKNLMQLRGIHCPSSRLSRLAALELHCVQTGRSRFLIELAFASIQKTAWRCNRSALPVDSNWRSKLAGSIAPSLSGLGLSGWSRSIPFHTLNLTGIGIYWCRVKSNGMPNRTPADLEAGGCFGIAL